MLLWANAFAAQNRVDPDNMDGLHQCLAAKDIPMMKYLCSRDDGEMLRERLHAIVSRVLVKYLPHFKENYSDCVIWHIPHQYSEESKVKSKLVNVLKCSIFIFACYPL